MKKIIVFENDEEFDEFAIDPQVRIFSDDNGIHYYDWKFTADYENEVENGTIFYIKDRNAEVLRRNSCTYKIISKRVENVKPYNKLIVEAHSPMIQIIDYKDYYNM